MKGYIDIYALPLLKRNLSIYRRMAKKMGAIFKEYGALEYREFVGEDLKSKWSAPFTSKIKLKAGEVLIFAVVEFRSKAHRSRLNRQVMEDPRVQAMITEKPPFDMKRMLYGGFETLVRG